ncbi:MAG: chemotaxis protein CheD [Candidatus Zixiibacteriota bacterium]|nr:MAG: chemotaxis protein CheD [candidate division Zixibacteria bacterium]
MSVIYVGVGEFAISNRPGEVVKTLGLGSCVAVIAQTPDARLVGLLHVALPESGINRRLAEERPGMFADTGIPQLLQEMRKRGWNSGPLQIKLAGGATIMDPNNTFNIGKRNLLAIRKVLWAFRLGAIAEDVGESISRTVWVNVGSGQVIVSSPGRGEWEL